MKLAVVGATGLVGSEMIKVLEEQRFPCDEFFAVASEKSAGKKVIFNQKEYSVILLEEAVAEKPDIAVFSAGSEVSRLWAPKFAAVGTTVIDNSSAWRMHGDVPLVVPEINAGILSKKYKIIANPNCSTIQIVMALAPLHKEYSIQRVVVSTYQSVTGTGMAAVNQLEGERKGFHVQMVYPHPIDLNVIPQGGVFTDDGYTTEEIKLVEETRKILGDENINLTATVVRVPVTGGHSASVNVTFKKDFSIERVKQLLTEMEGVIVLDDPANSVYPMPLNSKGRDEVFVGRIRRDFSLPNSINFWVVADNLRKGAATNAIQIAEYLLKNNLV